MFGKSWIEISEIWEKRVISAFFTLIFALLVGVGAWGLKGDNYDAMVAISVVCAGYLVVGFVIVPIGFGVEAFIDKRKQQELNAQWDASHEQIKARIVEEANQRNLEVQQALHIQIGDEFMVEIKAQQAHFSRIPSENEQINQKLDKARWNFEFLKLTQKIRHANHMTVSFEQDRFNLFNGTTSQFHYEISEKVMLRAKKELEQELALLSEKLGISSGRIYSFVVTTYGL